LTNKEFVSAISADSVAPGGMKAVEAGGREIVICNDGGRFYAIDRRCGHMNAPLDMGTLDGVILTCAMHCAQFDITTGEALSGPVPRDFNGEVPPPRIAQLLQTVGMLMSYIKTHSIRTYETRVASGMVWVAL
jgi:nitrite reductase/ring-hydroxylating ferredoxin subunit